MPTFFDKLIFQMYLNYTFLPVKSVAHDTEIL